MYDLSDVVDGETAPPGTNLLVSGPPLTGKRGLALRLLAAGTEQGQGSLIVTTKHGAKRMLEEYAGLVEDVEGLPLGVVDCVTRQQGRDDVVDDRRVRYASSPVDMTGIGIEFSAVLEEFHERGLRYNRILLYSVSTLLMYSDVQTVFRFLHVFTGRIDAADALGVHVVDSSAHDDEVLDTLGQLFDGVLHVEASEDGDEPATRLEWL